MKTIKVDNEEYEIISDEARMLSVHLVNLFHKLGIPGDLSTGELTPSAWRFIEHIVTLWKRFFPDEYYDWVAGMEYELKCERPIKEAIKSGGYTPVSYPMRFYSLMHTFLPNVKLQNKEFIKKFVILIPEFKNTNFKI